MEIQKKKDTDMTEGVIWKQLLWFALPLMVGNVFQQFYNTVDSIVVGNFVGKEALAAVGSVGSIINSVIGFFGGLATGASVVIAQSYGAKNDGKVSIAVHTTFCMTLVLCVVFTIVGISATPFLLRFMSMPDDVIGEATEYLMIYFSGVSGLMIYNMGSGVLRAVGDSKRPLYFLVFSACVNTVLDRELEGLGIGTWTTPKGGYFISFDSLDGCAKAIVAKCKKAGLVMTGAGATYPYGKDPHDSNIRIAPSYPPLNDLKQAMELFALCVKLVSVEKLLSEKKDDAVTVTTEA